MVETLEGIDAMGVGVYNGAQGKRLYYGLTRRPELSLCGRAGGVSPASRALSYR